jgi:hypothetical protein
MARAEADGLLHVAYVVEDKERNFAFEHDERFGLGRRPVTVRGNVGAERKDVQEAVRVVFGGCVEVMVGSQPGRGLCR